MGDCSAVAGLVKGGMHILQMLVAFAVLSANVYYEWTPNGYLAGLLAVAAAWAVTVIPFWIIDKARMLIAPNAARNQRRSKIEEVRPLTRPLTKEAPSIEHRARPKRS